MTPEERTQFDGLCKRIETEKNYATFEALLRELNSLLSKKERRLEHANAIVPGTFSGMGRKVMAAIAKRIIRASYAGQVEKVEVRIPEADELFSEIRVENSFRDDNGAVLAIRAGENLDVTLEAKPASFVKKESSTP